VKKSDVPRTISRRKRLDRINRIYRIREGSLKIGVRDPYFRNQASLSFEISGLKGALDASAS
jgi:hypothetical protein